MPVAFISTRTSPALGPSRSSSTISSGFFASNATAARVFICHISPQRSCLSSGVLSFEFPVQMEPLINSPYLRRERPAGNWAGIRRLVARALHAHAERQGCSRFQGLDFSRYFGRDRRVSV